jgi:hypothetical protein
VSGRVSSVNYAVNAHLDPRPVFPLVAVFALLVQMAFG